MTKVITGITGCHLYACIRLRNWVFFPFTSIAHRVTIQSFRMFALFASSPPVVVIFFPPFPTHGLIFPQYRCLYKNQARFRPNQLAQEEAVTRGELTVAGKKSSTNRHNKDGGKKKTWIQLESVCRVEKKSETRRQQLAFRYIGGQQRIHNSASFFKNTFGLNNIVGMFYSDSALSLFTKDGGKD